MAVLTVIVVTIAPFAGLPQWALMIGIFLMLVMDDAVAWYVKRWSADPDRPGGEEVCA
ncbi:hypothetical protein [Streptomyces sp. SID5643]|uniref:hypothetical protein n=1 Tax=Streptomyces sp. SID5643 TaxID=2690307 RepID=UPI00136AD8FC|nr:hypothetical protein [Streptomyces sp. SID5643]MZF87869.1 hypothetical protein [Streptomyces sp. SID5643]